MRRVVDQLSPGARMAAAGFCCVFGGTVRDWLWAGLSGLTIGFVTRCMDRLEVNPFFSTIAASFLMALPAYVAAGLGWLDCVAVVIIGALMLRMVVDGELAVEKTVSVGAMGGEKTKKALRLVKEPQDDMFKQKLFSVLQHAAGSDGVLSEKELKTYCSRHEKPLRRLLDAAASEGHRYFTERHCFKKTESHAKNEPHTLGGLTAEGKQKLGEVTGYRQYLRDFSLIAEREISEAPVWQEMLVYAMLFGVAGTVNSIA